MYARALYIILYSFVGDDSNICQEYITEPYSGVGEDNSIYQSM